MANNIDKEIANIDKSICRHIDNIIIDSRGEVSQDTVGDLRHYVEHIMFKIYCIDKNLSLDIEFSNIKSVTKYISSKGNYKYKLLKNFHKMLQSSVSHYKPTEEDSERLMLKYYEYLFRIRKMMKEDYDLDLLHNLENFPLNSDSEFREYYQKIADEIDRHEATDLRGADRFYIHKVKPFFINGDIYYEVTFLPANDKSSKTDRNIAFTKIQIESNYASKMNFVNSNIETMGHKMPILVIVGWEISIRECEFNNFLKLIKGNNKENKIGPSEKMALCLFMTKSKLNLLDIVELEDSKYELLKRNLLMRARITNFFDALDICRDIIGNNKSGKNILRYLLFTMNNIIIKNQQGPSQNANLSDLYIKNGARPFDRTPFNFSLMGHNPPFHILTNCFEADEYQPEMLARYVKNNTECNDVLFTSLKDIDQPEEKIQKLADEYNKNLWRGHRPDNELKIDKGQIFIKKYVKDCRFVIDELKELSSAGISNYINSVNAWLDEENNEVDCEEKKKIIKNMFANSKIAMIYGAAGTGKTTLINHIAHFFSDKNKLFLAQTNPAVDNLRRKVNASNCRFMTIAKLIKIAESAIVIKDARIKSDVLIIDECSTVSNSDMRKILENASFKLLILVGDTYQIEAIRFGNWFNIARHFISEASSELTKTYRSKDSGLLTLWDKVRKMDDNVLEHLTRQDYSNKLGDSIFQPVSKDEIILCLNYDGLYGINNINRFLQENNHSKSAVWGVQIFKVGDPILFHDIDRFGSAIYNNMKGRILNVSIISKGNADERIEFDIELDKIINGMDVVDGEFELLGREIYEEAKNSVIRFSVNKNKNIDEDNSDSRTIIPFQIAYAVSIHKAQGLEYDSVKVVITNEVDEKITHNIFYTAITRAKSHLNIYWSPEVENRILSTIKPKDNNKDAHLLYKVNLQ